MMLGVARFRYSGFRRPEAVRLLLDTHLLLWAAARSERLPREARELLEDDDNEVYYSAASD
jgi:PIN domain nuclease of toxin-antitoxin system